ncbi:MAG TPA: hypothetical protein VFE82_03085 [Ramlibacter sp.]|uniref:hypothetical protein n=1 Tax=Ramlibacter sp. TaxID=1917967 RepID=UPI002D39D18C|nr:hypothetical protein [Ramlibacter sp.]HZY17435.1 hypothetical protein [Ramlibacter sp.]
MREFLKKATDLVSRAKPAPTPVAPPGGLDATSRSLDVARTMLKAAVATFREELRKGACERRVNEARSAVVFWRERMQALMLGSGH